MLSAHTTNRKDGPLGVGNSLDSCSRVVEQLCGPVRVQLQLPHSYEFGDNLPLSVLSGPHFNTNAGKKASMDEACERALIALLRTDAYNVRLTASNFRNGMDGFNVVRRVAIEVGSKDRDPNPAQ